MSIWLSLPPPVHTLVLKKEIIYFRTYKYWPDKMWTIVRKRQMRQTRNTQWSVHLSLRAAVQTDGENIWWHEQEILTTKVFQKKRPWQSVIPTHTHCMSDVKSSCVLTESFTLSSGTAQTNIDYSADVTVCLAFAFCLLFLLVCGAAGGRSWVHWWSTQFLGFGSLHFLLDGLDVQFAFCGRCDRNKFNKRWDGG